MWKIKIINLIGILSFSLERFDNFRPITNCFVILLFSHALFLCEDHFNWDGWGRLLRLVWMKGQFNVLHVEPKWQIFCKKKKNNRVNLIFKLWIKVWVTFGCKNSHPGFTHFGKYLQMIILLLLLIVWLMKTRFELEWVNGQSFRAHNESNLQIGCM